MSSTTTINTTTTKIIKLVPRKKHVKMKTTNYKKIKIKNDLNKLRKSKIFRELGDAFDYFDL